MKRTNSIPGIPVLERDAALCDLLNKNDRRLLVIGNLCFLYGYYDAKPDCKYLYQCPIDEVSPIIWERLLEEVRNKKTPLILVPEQYRKKLPDHFLAFLQENYRQTDSLQGTLFIFDPSENSEGADLVNQDTQLLPDSSK